MRKSFMRALPICLCAVLLSGCFGRVPVKDEKEIRTEYIGDNSKTVQIAAGLPYPDGVSYESIEIQSESGPYELKIFVSGKKQNKEAFSECAKEAFERISNVSIVTFYDKESNSVIGSFQR